MSATRRKRSPSPAPRRKTPTRKRSQPPTPEAARHRELTTKRRGELAELAFTLKAASLGFGVAKPYGDSERYDFILDSRDLNWLSVTPLFPSVIPSGAGRRAKRTGLRSRGTPGSPALQRTRQGVSTPGAVRQPPPAEATCPVPPHLHRVQVKCSTQLFEGLYRVNAHRRVHGRAIPYHLHEIDFIVAYIIPEDSWFIIPLQAILGRTSLLFRRKRDPKPGQYDQYREAWHLLRPNQPKPRRGDIS